MDRVVFDTVVFVRSLLNRRSLWARLVFELSAEYQLIVSDQTVRELLGVLRRPELVRRYETLPGRDRFAILAMLRSAEWVVVDPATVPRISRDPKDDVFLATAKAGSADYLVTEDNDLLVLGSYDGAAIVNAATFLRVLGA